MAPHAGLTSQCTLVVAPTAARHVQGSQADFKNELLYKSFGINYNQLPARFRKVRCRILLAALRIKRVPLIQFCTAAGLGGVATASG